MRRWPCSISAIATRSRLAEALADLQNLRGGRGRSGEVALPGVLEESWNQEIAAVGAVTASEFEEPLPPREPPARGRNLSEEHEVVADPPSTPRRARCVARIAIRAIRLLERPAVLVVQTQHVRRACEQLEVVWRQLLFAVRAPQYLVGIRPRPIRISTVASLKSGGGIHDLVPGVLLDSRGTALPTSGLGPAREVIIRDRWRSGAVSAATRPRPDDSDRSTCPPCPAAAIGARCTSMPTYPSSVGGARPCGLPCGRGSVCRAQRRWTAAAAATASVARAKATKNASPCVSTSAPSWSRIIPERRPVLGEELAITVPSSLQQSRRALDVGEEKGDGASGKLRTAVHARRE